MSELEKEAEAPHDKNLYLQVGEGIFIQEGLFNLQHAILWIISLQNISKELKEERLEKFF
jgi:hypothetical protein